MICEYCGGEIKEKSNNCIYCGAPCKYNTNNERGAEKNNTSNKGDINFVTIQNITSDNNVPFYQKKDISPLTFHEEPEEDSSKSRILYIFLAIILGSFGIHNFYAGYTKRAICQVLLVLMTGWTVISLVFLWIWILIEIIIVKKDAKGVHFSL